MAILKLVWDHIWKWVDWHGRIATVVVILVSLGGTWLVRLSLTVWSSVSGQSLWIITLLVFAVFLGTLGIAGSKLNPRPRQEQKATEAIRQALPQSALALYVQARQLASELSDFVNTHCDSKGNPDVYRINFLYAAHYRDRVDRMLNELAAEKIFDVCEDWEINPQTQTARNIRSNIIDRLKSLADRLEAKNNAEVRPPSRNVGVRDWPGEWLDSERRFRQWEKSGVFAHLFSGQWTIRRDRNDDNPTAKEEVEAACELAGGRLSNSPGIALSDTVRDQTEHWKRWLQFIKETQGLNRTFLPNENDGYIEGLARVSALVCTKCAARAHDS